MCHFYWAIISSSSSSSSIIIDEDYPINLMIDEGIYEFGDG